MNDFFSMIYNWFGFLYEPDWDNYLYDNGYYSYLALVFILVAILVSTIFYFAPTVKFNGKVKWVLFMGISFLVTFIICFCLNDYFYNLASDDELGVTGIMDEFGVSFISGFWSMVCFFLLSCLCSKFSSHNYKIPF